MRYLHHEVHELDGYNNKLLWNVFKRLSRLTRESSFKDTLLDWALVNVFEDLNFLSYNYCEQNKTAHSEIYQRHRHLNLPLYQKLHLLHLLK